MFLNVVVSGWKVLASRPSIRSIGIFALSSLLVACNSGSEDDSTTVSQSSASAVSTANTQDTQDSKKISIKGGAIKGVIENGVVRVFSIENEAGLFRKSHTPLGDAERTDANGQFDISIPADTVDAIIVEITADSDTRMTCDVVNGCGINEQGNPIAFGETFALSSDFVLEAAYSGLQDQQGLTLYVTPLTHLAVSYAKEHIDGLSADSINGAYALVEDTLKLSKGSLQLPPPDLTKLDAYATLSGDELQYAIMSASFLAMVNMPDWSSVDEVINSAAERFSQSGGLPDENGGVISEVTLDDLFYRASDIANGLQHTVNNEQIIVELISVESSTEMYYQDVSSLYTDELAPSQGAVAGGSVTDGGVTNGGVSAGGDVLGGGGNVIEQPEQSPNVVVNTPAKLLQISSHPGSLTVDVNKSAVLSVAVQGDGLIRYQWRKDGVILDGENGSTLAFANVTKNDAGVYDVLVSNEAGQVPSLAATLAVEDVVYTAQLNWSIPDKRQDGTMLELSDIAGYVVAYGTSPDELSSQFLVDGAQSTQYPFENLDPSKTYYFKIATVDINNIQGEFSDVVVKSFM